MFRVVAAVALIWFVFFYQKGEVPVVVPADNKPSAAMQEKVAGVARIMSGASMYDRMAFAACWENAADAVEGSLKDVEVTFENSLGIQAFTQSVLRVAWQQIADASGKYDGLNEEVERLFASTFGMDVKPITEQDRDKYVELCRAIAWAGMPRG